MPFYSINKLIALKTTFEENYVLVNIVVLTLKALIIVTIYYLNNIFITFDPQPNALCPHACDLAKILRVEFRRRFVCRKCSAETYFVYRTVHLINN